MLRIARPTTSEGTSSGWGDVFAALRGALEAGELEIPLPGGGDTARRWAALCRYGRADLALGRLVEGHTDAVAILHESGAKPEPGALYGVWASRASGKGAVLTDRPDSGPVLTGTIPFCSGAGQLDRALVVARPDGSAGAADDVVIKIALPDARIRPLPDTWHAAGMADSRSWDVELHEVPVREEDRVGPPGFYTGRPGFRLGAMGVAAVWLGGTAGVVDRVAEHLAARAPDEHQLAHLAAMHVAVEAVDSTLATAAEAVDTSGTGTDRAITAGTCRSAAERAACEVLARAPRVTGPGPLSRDAAFTRRLADLEVYVRQHHAERELADLGRSLLLARAGERAT
ncbi:Acyl-CoA dehydrogenase [Actinopolyspora mzabensis]|uniref:Acyl-CoA dehydrogenase n=1 Tax=Actinopolyspora mzabensis TaxID=995066 RepID=A0A1G9A0C4_ACTMZ|nr:Acyl-CoA dehydrogenase [Actinopolyspora mzabensis]